MPDLLGDYREHRLVHSRAPIQQRGAMLSDRNLDDLQRTGYVPPPSPVPGTGGWCGYAVPYDARKGDS